MASSQRGTILVVDDQEMNREILVNILDQQYTTEQAENGRRALEILDHHWEKISAILLDVMMPEMDGYTFLKIMKEKPFANLPVIILTGNTGSEAEEKALKAGAWDFISKPYQPTILLSRLENAIARSQIDMLEQIKYTSEHDRLTGLYNRRRFFSETRKMLDEHPDIHFVMVRTDIDRFSLLNSFLGEKGGDEFLNKIADGLRKEAVKETYCTYGRISADIFCICLTYDQRKLETELVTARESIRNFNKNYFIKPTFGVYEITDRSMSVENMYECTVMAAKACKGKFNTYVGYYSQSMRNDSFRKQEIINEMQAALDEGQFVPYFQPKYDMKTNAPYGAEALIRWLHPTKGMISPGVFIPVFERNGFIGKIDYYMWDTVCGLIKKWQLAGLNPAPISVNISRANMYNPNVVNILRDVVKKHDISPKMLNLELTESAYMDNPDVMKSVVRRLQESGFTVMMDDFGSGYSSLNTLKEISVDILKIDMKFLKGDDGTGRSERILSSMIRMAGWLSLPVIVEGVETKHQVDFLKSIGCGYIQGFYFARPMPEDNYEKLIQGLDSGLKEPTISSPDPVMSETIWSADPYIEFLFNHTYSPLAIYEYDGKQAFPLRVNAAFNEFFGYGSNSMDFTVTDENEMEMELKSRIHDLCLRVCENLTMAVSSLEIRDQKGILHEVQLALHYMGEVEDRKVLFAYFLDHEDSIVPLKNFGAKKSSADSMQHIYTKAEFDDTIRILKKEVPIVRLVEPLAERVVDLKTMKETKEICHDIWGRRDRCENCTSARALSSKDTCVKIEILGNKTFLIISKYAEVDKKPLVLEMVYDTSSGFLLEARRKKGISEIVENYNHLLITDSLTGIYNRRYLDEDFIPSILCCRDKNKNLNIAMLDIDHFKAINDTYGHIAGDVLLKDVGSFCRLQFNSREKGKERLAVRYGGDEILLIGSDMPFDEFRKKVEHAYGEMRKICYGPKGVKIPFSVSFGFASSEELREDWTWNQLLSLADRRMYEAKHPEGPAYSGIMEAGKPEAIKEADVKPAAEETGKKAVKKAAKPAVKKTAKKTSGKTTDKTAAKTAAGKAVRKTAARPTGKTAEKGVGKAAGKTAQAGEEHKKKTKQTGTAVKRTVKRKA